MIKRIFTTILLCAVLLSTAGIANTQMSESRFSGTLRELEVYLFEGIEDSDKLSLLETNFFNTGGRGGKLLAVYCKSLHFLAEEEYEMARIYAGILNENAEFTEFLTDIDAVSIENAEILSLYIDAREAEACGDYEAALELYGKCITFFDVLTRHEDIIFTVCESKYAEGQEALINQDYEKAIECFEYVSDYGYNDSKMLLEYIKTMASSETATVTSTAIPTPVSTPMPTSSLEPTTSPTVDPEISATPESADESTATPTSAQCPNSETYWSTIKAATCVKQGSQKKVCKNCGATVDKRSVSKKGHSFGSWSIKNDTTDKRSCSVCGVSEERAIVYGSWSQWSKTAVSASKGSVQVESKVESEKVSTKTTYSYRRYLYYHPVKGYNMASYGETYAKNMGYKGSWQSISLDYKLTYIGKEGGYNEYKGYLKDNNLYWFYEKVNTEDVFNNVTYYRYRKRTN